MITGSGYTLFDDEGEEFLRPRDPALEAKDCRLCHVAGVTYRSDTLQKASFGPGSRVVLKRDPRNPYDKNAVGVWDGRGRVQAGWVPAHVCTGVAAEMRAGKRLDALVVREYKRVRDGQRLGIAILIAPAGAINLEVWERSDGDEENEDASRDDL